jgi:hypothetical protein
MSLAMLQACAMAGPKVAAKLTESALHGGRTLHFGKSFTDQLSSLSAETLEIILKEEKLAMSEYEWFQVLHSKSG